jgi:hypothetical protein
VSSDPGVRDAPMQQRPVLFAVLLIVLGVIGWTAAFALTNDKFAALENPDAGLGCDFSLLVQCSANLNSVQGAVFGIPVSGIRVDGLAESTLQGPDWLDGGGFGAEASVLAVLTCCIASLLLARRMLRKGSVVRPFWKR